MNLTIVVVFRIVENKWGKNVIVDFTGAKRAAPQRPREQPPSLPRSPSPLLGSMSSLQDVLKVNDTL